MPQPPSTETSKPRRIQRSHSGCKQCRRRGKRCDETKPCCGACTRLALECSYGVVFRFQHRDQGSFPRKSPDKPTPLVQSNTCAEHYRIGAMDQLAPKPSATLNSGHGLQASYLDHFQRHVRHLIPTTAVQLMPGLLQSPALRPAVLCISASNLSMLNARVQSRILPEDSRRSVFSPLVNDLHHNQAQKYHDQALWFCRAATHGDIERHAATLLIVHTLLAYYHHASTDHSQFRLAVWESVRFVLRNAETILRSPDGPESLQMWYRLCMSHRLAKPPSLLLEGEGTSSFGPNSFPDALDHLHLRCILGMSADDLIYDILIKTMEIRTRMVMFRSVAGIYGISEESGEIGSLTHAVLNKLLGRSDDPDELVEAQESFVRGHHLLGLLHVQQERLKVWRSRLRDEQLLGNSDHPPRHPGQGSDFSIRSTFPTHRDAMNALYSLLCEMIFEEAHGKTTSPRGGEQDPGTMSTLAGNMCRIACALEFTTSNTADVYTFSLAETLLQLVFLWRSDAIFHDILDVIWPQLEIKARGYEHSHYPTHIVKRIITQVAVYWSHQRVVTFALPAVTENISKLRLLDIDQPIGLVVGGHDGNGQHFIERVALP